jgi:hypothetical protein
MNTKNLRVAKLGFISTFVAAITIMVLAGCQSSSTGGDTTTRPLLGFLPPPADKSGTELWVDNCARCHNSRAPQEFSPRQWATIVHHMRLRADLTGEEARKITEFLKAAS